MRENSGVLTIDLTPPTLAHLTLSWSQEDGNLIDKLWDLMPVLTTRGAIGELTGLEETDLVEHGMTAEEAQICMQEISLMDSISRLPSILDTYGLLVPALPPHVAECAICQTIIDCFCVSKTVLK